jgi:thiosulfate/3-mercaptopyruvate sulfurtransferase
MRRSAFQKACLLAFLCVPLGAYGQQASPTAVPAAAPQRIEPEELAKIVGASSGEKPRILMVGPHSFYGEAHIPGSEFIGATKDEAGLEALRDHVKGWSKDQFIVLYCGCCPWNMCPNVRPAYQQLAELGFTHVKMLYIDKNFGTDWVKKGYPVEKGR